MGTAIITIKLMPESPETDLDVIQNEAIGMIDDMISYSKANAPLSKDLHAEEVGAAAAFLLSPLASAITGEILYVDNGMHAMGLAVDSAALIPK